MSGDHPRALADAVDRSPVALRQLHARRGHLRKRSVVMMARAASIQWSGVAAWARIGLATESLPDRPASARKSSSQARCARRLQALQDPRFHLCAPRGFNRQRRRWNTRYPSIQAGSLRTQPHALERSLEPRPTINRIKSSRLTSSIGRVSIVLPSRKTVTETTMAVSSSRRCDI